MMKFKFYLQYILRKFVLNLFEIKKPIGKLFLINILYSFSRIATNTNWEKYANIDYIVTKFGRFHVRPKTFDVICASPDFERPDIILTVKIINRLLKNHQDVIYLDIGADFGLYSILLGNKFRNLRIYGFEPFRESYKLFLKNISENNLANKVKAFNFGLYDSNGVVVLKLNSINPGSNSINGLNCISSRTININVKTLDNFWETLGDDGRDTLFIKLDVEGVEKQVLTGSVNVINSFSEIYIMVEDSIDNIDNGIKEFLKREGFKEIAKMTPYNSFWYRKNNKKLI